MEMMAVRIMTQPLFPRIFPGVCPYSVCFIGLQGLHRTTGTLYFWAMHRYQSTRRPGTDRSISWRLMETKGLHNPHRSRKSDRNLQFPIHKIVLHAQRDAAHADECPLLGVKRTSLGRAPMSANDQKRTSSGYLPAHPCDPIRWLHLGV